MALPGRLSPGPHWLLPALELALLCALVASSPGRLERRSGALRAGGLALAGLLSLANAASAALLVNDLARSSRAESAASLLLAGGSIWAANVLIFALWYWELDRGGPVDRCHAVRKYPDFLFPQMQQPDLAPADSHGEQSGGQVRPPDLSVLGGRRLESLACRVSPARPGSAACRAWFAFDHRRGASARQGGGGDGWRF